MYKHEAVWLNSLPINLILCSVYTELYSYLSYIIDKANDQKRKYTFGVDFSCEFSATCIGQTGEINLA